MAWLGFAPKPAYIARRSGKTWGAAHDMEKPEMADREITLAVIFPNSKKISKLGTEAQFRKSRRARIVMRQGGQRRRRRSARVSHSSSLTLEDSGTLHYICWCNSLQTSKVGLNFGVILC
jgi:hypothetical protein